MLGKLFGTKSASRNIKRDHVVSASNTAGVINISAPERGHFILHKLLWSYDNDPTNGNVLVESAGDVLDFDITNKGPGGYNLSLVCEPRQALMITIAAGGVGVVGKLYIEYTLEEA